MSRSATAMLPRAALQLVLICACVARSEIVYNVYPAAVNPTCDATIGRFQSHALPDAIINLQSLLCTFSVRSNMAQDLLPTGIRPET